MSTISEPEFKQLCDEIYRDRLQVCSFNPNMGRREALLWMLSGCLVSLLSVPIRELPGVSGGASADPYANAIGELLQHRMSPAFNPQIYLAELSEKLEAED